MDSRVTALIERIRAIDDHVRTDPHLDKPFIYRSSVQPNVERNAAFVERQLSVRVPQDLAELWRQISSVRLFEDIHYEQWGFILWSPEQTVTRQRQRTAAYRDRLVAGDVVVGEFLGDADMLVVRCDPEAPDFGHVLIALPTEPREKWPVIAPSLLDYLDQAITVATPKYWP